MRTFYGFWALVGVWGITSVWDTSTLVTALFKFVPLFLIGGLLVIAAMLAMSKTARETGAVQSANAAIPGQIPNAGALICPVCDACMGYRLEGEYPLNLVCPSCTSKFICEPAYRARTRHPQTIETAEKSGNTKREKERESK